MTHPDLEGGAAQDTARDRRRAEASPTDHDYLSARRLFDDEPDAFDDHGRQTLRPSGPASGPVSTPPSQSWSGFSEPLSNGLYGSVREGEVLARRYRVEQCLGRTGHEIVVIARHVDLGQRVVLRYLSTEALDVPEVVSAFQRSARKAFELRSEHAERVMDFGRLERGNPYRVAELPRGPSLDEVLRVRGPLPVDEAVDMVITASEAVAEAHAARLVYKNLGTSNIFVDRRSDGSPLVKVVDFGMLDSVNNDILRGYELAIPGASSMTRALPYIAPEQIRNPGGVDHRADIWGLGGILYELLAGRPAFAADTSIALLAMIAADTPESLSALRGGLPSALVDVVDGCLRKDPRQRPQSVGELARALAPFASPEIRTAALRIGQVVPASSRPPATSFSAGPPGGMRWQSESVRARVESWGPASEAPSAEGRAPEDASKSAPAAPSVSAPSVPSSLRSVATGPRPASTLPSLPERPTSRWALFAAGGLVGMVSAAAMTLVLGGRAPEAPTRPASATVAAPKSAAAPAPTAARTTADSPEAANKARTPPPPARPAKLTSKAAGPTAGEKAIKRSNPVDAVAAPKQAQALGDDVAVVEAPATQAPRSNKTADLFGGIE